MRLILYESSLKLLKRKFMSVILTILLNNLKTIDFVELF